MSNLFCIYLPSDMFLFMATWYAQSSLKIVRLGSQDDSMDRHVEEGGCSLSVGGRMAASVPCYSPMGVHRLPWKQLLQSQYDIFKITTVNI